MLRASDDAAPASPNLDTLVVDAAGTPTPAAAPAAVAAGDAAIPPAPEKFEGPAKLRPPPAALRARATGTQSGTWAVVIGINDYPGTAHDLRSAVSDATDVDQALASLGVAADHRLVITEGQATAAVIGTAVDWLAARAGPDAVGVFFFAGHVRKLGASQEAMVGADGRTVTDVELARRLARVQARRLWVGMAACYGGGFTEVLRQGVVLTGAAPANDRAYENSTFNRSYMVEYMVRQAMIEGRAAESVQAAFAYARDALSRDFPDRVPVQFDGGSAPLDLRPPGFTPARSSAPAPAPGSGSGSSGDGSSAPPPTTTTTAPPPKQCTLGIRIGC